MSVAMAFEQNPAVKAFEVTSSEQQDITEFPNEMLSLIRENQLVLVNETPV
jgi:hypothetical protein